MKGKLTMRIKIVLSSLFVSFLLVPEQIVLDQ